MYKIAVIVVLEYRELFIEVSRRAELPNVPKQKWKEKEDEKEDEKEERRHREKQKGRKVQGEQKLTRRTWSEFLAQ